MDADSPAGPKARFDTAATLTFHATIELEGINPYVVVDAERAQRLRPGWRRPMPVLVQVDGYPDPPWRINMMPKGGGRFFLYLHGDVRKASGTGIGDRVEITLQFDTTYQAGPAHAMPPALVEGLDRDPAARSAWEALSPSRQKEVLRYLAGLKSEAAKARNAERALRVLGGARERFMARDWNSDRDQETGERSEGDEAPAGRSRSAGRSKRQL